MDDINSLIKGALLHDIGKICYRAGKSYQNYKNHSHCGAEFLKEITPQGEDIEAILNCVRYHHQGYIEQAERKGWIKSNSDLCYIVYEADNIAAAMDRRVDESDDNSSKFGFTASVPLCSVFKSFGAPTPKEQAFNYALTEFKQVNDINYPSVNNQKTMKAAYGHLLNDFSKGLNIAKMNCNNLLFLLKKIMYYVPSSTCNSEIPDISLYVHSKITAAIASCMKIYFDESHINDYRSKCYANTKEMRDFRADNIYLLVKGDFQGIQDFIYTIPSKGALKSIRGRSFYAEILLKQFINNLLGELKLSNANILHDGGGHFHLLLPNTQKTVDTLKDMQNKFNDWLLTKFNSSLFLAIGYKDCCANDLKMSNLQHNIFDEVTSETNYNNFTRYNTQTLRELFNFDSKYNTVLDNTRECAICHTSNVKTYVEYNDDSDTMVCPNCMNLYKLGEQILSKKLLFVVSDEETGDTLPIFAYKQQAYLSVIEDDITKLIKYQEQHKILSLYSKNQDEALSLAISDYTVFNDNHTVKTFDELAKSSCGINRVGTLCINVDDLEAAFISGFVQENHSEVATFSRYANLAENISLFFKTIINKICAGNLNNLDNNKPFHLFEAKQNIRRNVHIIYAGGDEAFFVGSWQDVIDVAVDIKRAFSQFTQHKLTLSAGIALFTPSYPISQMVQITKALMREAKKQPNKNSVALFGFNTEVLATQNQTSCAHVYTWQEFTSGVHNKLKFLFKHFNFSAQKDNNKLTVGKSLLYRLLDLIDITKQEKLNLARFAYVLARMQPTGNNSKQLLPVYNQMSSQMYAWLQNSQTNDKKELHTALNLLIYYLRN